MTQTNDPPLISSLELIPDAAEKADLDAPSGSGGKLVIGQAPNITITETSVVADAAERLALDVQEGDVAVQTNVSSSFIFTGGANIAPNWQILDFDAVGAIDGEDINPRDITPRNITASGDISLQDLTVAGAINGADTTAAAAGEALTSDGSGNFSFASVGGDITTVVADTPETIVPFINIPEVMQKVAASQTAMQAVAASQTAMQEVIESPTAIQAVRQSPTADSEFHLSNLYAETLEAFASINTGVSGGIDDIAASQTAVEEVAASQTAMEEVGSSATAKSVFENSNTAIQGLNNSTTSGSQQINFDLTTINDLNGPHDIYVQSIFVPTGTFSGCETELVGDGFDDILISGSDINLTIEGFVNNVQAGQCVFNFSAQETNEPATYEYIPI